MAKLWMTMHEPRVVTFGFVLAYAIFAYGGLIIVATDHGMLPLGVYTARMVAGWCLVVGGLIGAPTAWKGAWWAERVATVFIAFAVFARILAILGMGELYDDGQQAFAITIWAALIAVMWARFAWVEVSPFRGGAGPLLPEMDAALARVRAERAERGHDDA